MSGQRVALITGCSRGIGAAIATHLAEAGMAVHGVYRNDDAAAETVRATILDAGGDIHLHRVDLAIENEICALVAKLDAQHGAIHVLVNNAAITDDLLLPATPTDRWNRVLNVNLTAPFLLMREVVPLMLDEGWGRIINISSVSANSPGPGQSAYAAAKGGLEALTRAAAAELGHKGIRVNTVAPGAIETDMTRGLREKLGGASSRRPWGQPNDIAGMVAFLASDAADYIQGQLITIDGGRSTARPH